MKYISYLGRMCIIFEIKLRQLTMKKREKYLFYVIKCLLIWSFFKVKCDGMKIEEGVLMFEVVRTLVEWWDRGSLSQTLTTEDYCFQK